MKHLNLNKQGKVFLGSTMIGLLISCGNPEVDAKKVCDCYSKVDSLSTEDDVRKCIRLSEDMTIKYVKDPEKLLRFSRALQCADSSKTQLGN